MTPQANPKPGDIAVVPSADYEPLFWITSIETDDHGAITAYNLSELTHGGGHRVEAHQVAGVFTNVLNSQE